jgi:hypothetical protein
MAPFPKDPLQAREAQETGRFIPAKERRPEIPTSLSELISEMLSPNARERPNAFTLMERLGTALQTGDWISDYEAGKRHYGEGDAETAFNYFERAAFSAPEDGRRSAQYRELLEYLIDTADSCSKILAVAQQLVQPIVATTVGDPKATDGFDKFVSKLISEPAVEPQKQEFQCNALRMLVELVLELPPVSSLVKGIHQLLKNLDHPALWRLREDIYLIGLLYRDAELLEMALVGALCIRSARKLRERDGTLLHAQVWLRRAEKLGVTSSPEYRKERDAVDTLLRKTATPPVLPPIPSSQEPASRTVGEGEKAHLNVRRITAWVNRLQRLHPYVQGVRRVRKDPNLPLTPTRLLSLDNIGQHLTAAMSGLEPTQVIPAVLDESFCEPKGSTVLRVNLVLPRGTTVAQREAAVGLLREDTSLFGPDAD